MTVVQNRHDNKVGKRIYSLHRKLHPGDSSLLPKEIIIPEFSNVLQ